MSYLLDLTLVWEAWAILGLILIVIDVLYDGAGNILAAGAACFIMSGLIGISRLVDLEFIETWETAFVVYAVSLVPAVVIIRYLRPRNQRPDINKY